MWVTTFVLASMSVPFQGGQLDSYVRELCQEATKTALPRDVSSTTALQSLAVCFFAFSDMAYAGQPTQDCGPVVLALKPDDPGAAMAVCECAVVLTRSWAAGRY